MMATRTGMPPQVALLTLAAFAIGTAEFVVAGLMTQLAADFGVTEGQAGWVVTGYALAIVIGGPILTLWLARFNRRTVLVGLLVLFVIGNVISATTDSFIVLVVARVVTGLTQGPFYGIGAVLAAGLVPDRAGQAVGRMFAGLTLANVLGVPLGTWIGTSFGWHVTFWVVAGFGVIAAVMIAVSIPSQRGDGATGVLAQLAIFKNKQLVLGLAITVLGWTGFMTFYAFLAPIAESVAGIDRDMLTWVLVIVGVGLVVGNSLGGRSADRNLSLSLLLWPIVMSISLAIVGLVAHQPILFVAAAFLFGVASFANVPPMQLRVMQHGGDAPELAATANISAFNLANAIGGILGGLVIDSSLGAQSVPFAAAIVPLAGILLVLVTLKSSSKTPVATAA